MSEKISQHVNKNFNTELAGDLGLSGRQRISVIFKIDKNGNITDVRSRAPHPGLEREAARVINKLPKMQPGKQRGKAVTVQYSLPIIFQVQD
jgi:protein TonB